MASGRSLAGAKGYIHYWLIESENDPANDPIVYWTNGGPGGSGISTGRLKNALLEGLRAGRSLHLFADVRSMLDIVWA
eukprot:scaffold771_cov387-Prasinococcus_capsulatus_cf.AAC.17